ncbi:MAG: peptidase M61, partial [Novosphingobium sp.]
LVWLEADQIIRAGTGGKKSIDDFAKLFFGMNDGDWGQVAFEADEIVAKLNQVYPYDWKRFIDTKINQPGQPVPVQGIEKGGYKLVWKDEPNPYDKARFAEAKVTSLAYSLGIGIDKDAKVTGTQWDSPAFSAGVVTGSKILAVNGVTYDGDGLKKAITAAKSGAPLELLFQRGDRFQTVRIDYKGGLRYPWLERTAAGKAPAGLDLLLQPKRAVKAPAKAKK